MHTPFLTRAMLLAIAAFVSPELGAESGELQRPGYVLQTELIGQGPLDIVFESGFGQGPDAWSDVVAELGASCHCLAYAQAGQGTPGTTGQARTLQDHVDDLGAVAQALAPDRPVVLVGHSYGGLVATEFARRHPGRVAALVLVDPTTLGQRHAFMAADRERVLADDKMLLDMLPPALGADYLVLMQQLDAPEVAATPAMPDIPVVLLTSTQVAQDRSSWKKPPRASRSGSACTARCSPVSRGAATSTSPLATTSIARSPRTWPGGSGRPPLRLRPRHRLRRPCQPTHRVPAIRGRSGLG